MDSCSDTAAAEKSPNMTEGVCWECGKHLLCNEYIVCCTGTIFHICPECEAKVNERDSSSEPEN